jgi:hypothetical protein
MPYVTVTADVNVDVDLCDFRTSDLVEELESRGETVTSGPVSDEVRTIIENLYQKRRIGKDYQAELDELIHLSLGRVI